jgi:hypothetical protein
MSCRRCRTFPGFRRSGFAKQTLLRKPGFSDGQREYQQPDRLTSHGIQISLGLLLQLGSLPLHPVLPYAIRNDQVESIEAKVRLAARDSRPVSTLLLCKFPVDGPFDLTGLLHNLRPSSGRCLLETGVCTRTSIPCRMVWEGSDGSGCREANGRCTADRKRSRT